MENALEYFKSLVDQDRCDVVLCNLEHEIIYMNPAAIKDYVKWGGADLIGRSLLAWWTGLQQTKITISCIPFSMKNSRKISI